MAKQGKTADAPALSSQKRLPNDRESLGLLLRTCERAIEYFNEVACRQINLHKACAAAIKQNGFDFLADARMQAVGISAQNQMAKPRPSMEAIWPYLGSQYDALIAELRQLDILHLDCGELQSIPVNAVAPEYERVVTIVQGLLACLHQIQGEIATKLEVVCDTFCDIPNKSYKIPTDDPDLLKLISEDRKRCNLCRTQFVVALEVMKGHERDARSLLRKAHRKELLQPRRRKSDKARA